MRPSFSSPTNPRSHPTDLRIWCPFLGPERLDFHHHQPLRPTLQKINQERKIRHKSELKSMNWKQMCIMTIISATNKHKYLFELMNQIMRIMHIYFRVFPLCSVSFRDTKCAASVRYSQRYTTLWSTNLCTNKAQSRTLQHDLYTNSCNAGCVAAVAFSVEER